MYDKLGTCMLGIALMTVTAIAAEPETAKIIKQPLPDKTVVLTFDDAVRSQITFVAPLLKELGFGATFYVCDFPRAPKDEDKYMTWDQIAELHNMGFEIGNHTRSHPHIGKIPEEKIIEELDYIDRQCQTRGIPVTTTFAYPGYGLNEKALPIFVKRGILFARAGGNRCYDPTVDHPYLVPSFDIAGTDEKKVIGFLNQVAPGKIAVLTIHGVPDLLHPWVNTPPEVFERYMKYLKDNGYTVLAMRDLAEYVDAEKARTQLENIWRKRFQ